jgi:chromosome segregation ATPase
MAWEEQVHVKQLNDATTPGLNDAALAGDLEACRPKVKSAERRVKELENTVKQLRANNAKLKSQYSSCFKALEEATTDCQNMHYQLECLRGEPEQAGCRKPDTQCEHTANQVDEDTGFCSGCGKVVIE